MRKTLSVVLATFNEEKNLGACLDSLRDIADEIVIVDGTSSDKTVAIAKKYGARVKVTTNKANFHINKQMAIDMAKCDWILQMDADEHVSPEMKKEIKEILEKDPKDFNGYWMPRKNYFLGRFLMKGGQYPDYTLRLYRNGRGHLPQKDVHEQAVVEGEVGYLKTALLHYPYKDFAFYLKKWNRYNDFIAVQIKDDLKNKNIIQKITFGIDYLIVKPIYWLLLTFIRHKGFMDSWQGFTFSLFSALRFPVSYIKYIGVFKFCTWLIILLAVILRFWNFPSRWGLGGDDGRDALIALESIKRSSLPLIGSFSSAGPFVFGGLFYCFIILSYLILPFAISAPWIFLAVIGVLTVIAAIYLGKELGGEKLALVMGLLAATSPQLVTRSTMLGQHTFISTFAALLVLCFFVLWRTKKKQYSFLAGLFLGLALNFHYQAVNLIIFIPAILMISSLKIKDRILSVVLMLIGTVIPLAPLLYWDAHQSFANLRNLADYLLIGQYRLYVPNSWSIFILKIIPGYFSFVVGRFQLYSFVLFLGALSMFAYSTFKKRVSNKLILVNAIFLILLVINRYYHGERSEGYLLYLVPFLLIIYGWFLENLAFNHNKKTMLTGIILLSLTILFNLSVDLKYVNYVSPYASYNNLAKTLYATYPNTKFAIYDYKYEQYIFSMPLSLIMSFDDKSDKNGKRIGLGCIKKGCPANLPIISDKVILTQDLASVGGNDINSSRKLWINVNQSSVYNDLTGWLNKNQLKSNFSFTEYLKNKINL